MVAGEVSNVITVSSAFSAVLNFVSTPRIFFIVRPSPIYPPTCWMPSRPRRPPSPSGMPTIMPGTSTTRSHSSDPTPLVRAPSYLRQENDVHFATDGRCVVQDPPISRGWARPDRSWRGHNPSRLLLGGGQCTCSRFHRGRISGPPPPPSSGHPP